MKVETSKERIKLLNLYAGIGGNIELLDEEIYDITNIELNPKIAKILQDRKPNQKVLIEDAHEYLLNHYQEFYIIWASRPCQKHSKMNKATRHNMIRYVDGGLFEEIIFLDTYFKGKWIVENVVPYYMPYGSPTKLGRHLFWSNFEISEMENLPKSPKGMMNLATVGQKQIMHDWLGIQYEGNVYYEKNHCPVQILRNCVHPLLGKHVIDCIDTNPESN